MTERLPPRVAFAQLAMQCPDEASLRARLARLPEGDPVRALAGEYPDGWRIVREVLAAVNHNMTSGTPAEHVRQLARMFDGAASVSPAASVALHSLGDVQALEASTTEIVSWLSDHDLLALDARVLDFGCGIGRLETLLAPRVAEIVAIDISPVMLAEARHRCAALANVSVLEATGLDLAPFSTGFFDLVVAVDSFPYVVAAGGALASRLLEEAARVLAPGKFFAIFNYAYQGTVEGHIAELASLASAAGLTSVIMGEQPFGQWDGRAFLLWKR